VTYNELRVLVCTASSLNNYQFRNEVNIAVAFDLFQEFRNYTV